MLVSVIIPTYNRALLIGETLNSLIAQTHRNWECIIVDDGSSDNTDEIVKKYTDSDSRFKYFKRPIEKLNGGNASRNFGLQKSCGSIINWLDSDDILLFNHLEIHLNFHAQENVDAIITSGSFFRENRNNIINSWKVVDSGNVINEMIYNHILWPINCVSWKRNAISSNPFNEELISSQEWTFHLNQLISGKTYSAHDIVSCLIRSHDNRIGKIASEEKNNSTFKSRKIILALLRDKQRLSSITEKGLMGVIFLALRLSIQQGHNRLASNIIKFLVREYKRSSYKKDILTILFIALPIYSFTKKGERLFKIK